MRHGSICFERIRFVNFPQTSRNNFISRYFYANFFLSNYRWAISSVSRSACSKAFHVIYFNFFFYIFVLQNVDSILFRWPGNVEFFFIIRCFPMKFSIVLLDDLIFVMFYVYIWNHFHMKNRLTRNNNALLYVWHISVLSVWHFPWYMFIYWLQLISLNFSDCWQDLTVSY